MGFILNPYRFASGPVPEYTDDFNRADGTTLGASWGFEAGRWALQSGELKRTFPSTSYIVWEQAVSSVDQWVEFTVRADIACGATLRNLTSPFAFTDNRYRCSMSTSGQVNISRQTGGSVVVLDSSSGYTGTATGQRHRWEIEGSEIRCYIDGVLEVSYTDASPHTVGSYTGLLGTTNSLQDDFATGAL